MLFYPTRFLRYTGMSLAVVISSTFALSSISNAAPVTDKPKFPALIYWDNWTDAQGVSHLTKCRITSFRPEDDKQNTHITNKNKNTSSQAMIWTGVNKTGSATVTTTVQPPGWKSKWQNSKRVEWIVPVAGVYTTQAMDGTRIELNPGDILLNEDTSSIRDQNGHQGHFSSNEGNEASALLITRFNVPAKPTHTACTQN